MPDLTVRFTAQLVADTDTDITGGGIPAGKAGSMQLRLVNPTESAIAVTPMRKTTGGAPTAADVIHPAFEIEAGGWWSASPVKMGDGYKLFIQADGPLAVEFIGRAEG